MESVCGGNLTVGSNPTLSVCATEDAGNVALYEHLGYEVTGHAIVAPELETWNFFRPDSFKSSQSPHLLERDSP